ncbi:MAG: hypothetical protein M3Q34_04460 [bacterium]|nr:hypothetical protein [bacterium]
MSLIIRSLNELDPYGAQVEQFFASELPANIGDLGSVVDSVAAAFISTNKIRYGSAPTPESIVVMRSAIRYCVEQKIPIRILCPWGSKKPLNCKSIDIAEVMGLKALACLNARIRKFYEPGIQVNLRIEDTSGYHLFAGQDGVRKASEKYVQDFLSLINILGYKDFINPLPESSLVNETDFFVFAEKVKLVFLDYIEETDLNGFGNIDSLSSWNTLKGEYGWSGIIPAEMRDFFRGQYGKMYQNVPEEHKTELLCRYFAGSLARYKLKATGKLESWGQNFIQLNFAQEAPGTPAAISGKRIICRTIPANFCETHLPPWRAFGFLEIRDSVKPKITSWFNPENINLCPGNLIFSDGTNFVNVNACYKSI